MSESAAAATTTTMTMTTKLEIEGVVFPSNVTPFGSSKTLFLGGAGIRGLEIEGKFKIFTVIGVYLQTEAVAHLSSKWKGKTSQELASSVQFFRDIVTGPFDKFTQVTLIAHLTGEQYSDKVIENCVNIWKSLGIYSEKEDTAAERFKQVFKPMDFPPGSSIFFTHSASGPIMVGFSKDTAIPETENGVIDSKALSEAVLESIIGENGVSPATKRSLASRIYKLINTN